MKCCVCGKKAKKIHYSIMGQIQFHVCNKHYKETTPGMSWDWNGFENSNRVMGLLDKNHNFVELKNFKGL